LLYDAFTVVFSYSRGFMTSSIVVTFNRAPCRAAPVSLESSFGDYRAGFFETVSAETSPTKTDKK